MSLRRSPWCAVGCVILALGCGERDTPAAAPAPTPPPAATVPAPTPAPTPSDDAAAAPTPVAPAAGTGWTLRGTVTAPVPTDAPPPLRMTADPYCKRAHDAPVLPQSASIGPGGEVQWAFVYIKAGLEELVFAVAPEPVVLRQVGCMYEPHVFGVQTGQTIEIYNNDQTLHNVHARAKKPNKSFNLAHPAVATMVHRRSFEVPEVMVHFKCDVHPWMSAYAGVLPHPLYAVTDATGAYEIRDLPSLPTPYTVAVWHETLGELEQQLTGPESGEVRLDFAFPAP